MTLYSLHNTRPAPLPFRITLPNGFTRTDPSTFTEDEIASAGFTGPYIEPPYDPATEQLDWVDGAYVIIEQQPVIEPNWPSFKLAMLTNPDINAAIATAMHIAPLAVLALPTALNNATDGDYDDFRSCWTVIRQVASLPAAVIAAVHAEAEAANLPPSFMELLG